VISKFSLVVSQTGVSRDRHIEALAFLTPEANNIHFRRLVEQIKKYKLDVSRIKQDSLYITMPHKGDTLPRVFFGTHLLSPRIIIPTVGEMKAEYKWLLDNGKLAGKKPSNWYKEYDVDDLYEEYLRMAVSQIESYIYDVDKSAQVGCDLFKWEDFSIAFFSMLIDDERKELGRLNTKVTEYRSKNAPKWMRSLAERMAFNKGLLIRALERSIN
jgi:hypothetical protein